MAKNLRKTLSKNKVSQPKQAETEKINKDSQLSSAYQIANTEPSSNDIDPLNFFDKPLSETQVNPLKFLDLIASTTQEKREREKELEKQKEFKEQTGFKDIGQINKNRLTLVQSSRIKPENKPMKLVESLDPWKDEVILKRFTKQEKPHEPRVLPGKLDKINMPEMDHNQKQHLIERMSSARQNMSKIAFGKALIKRTSETILEKAKNLEEKIQPNILNHGTMHLDNEQPFSSYIIKDSDVQIVNEITGNNVNNQFKPIKDVDIESLMKPKKNEKQNTTEPRKDNRSIADIILKRPAQAGKKKITTPVFDLDKKD